MDKLTAIKIKYNDGTYSDEIPVSVLAENVRWSNNNNLNLTEVLGNVKTTIAGTVQDQIDALANEKADASDVTSLGTRVTNVEIEISGIANGSPTPVATVAEMTDESAVYLYTGSETGYTAGNWYFWNGSAWTSGGTYGGAVTDTTLSISGSAADAKAVGDALAEKADEIGELNERLEGVSDSVKPLTGGKENPATNWEIGNIAVNATSGYTYNSSGRRIRTKEGISYHLKQGNTVTIKNKVELTKTDQTKETVQLQFWVSWYNATLSKYEWRNYDSSKFTAPIESDYVFVIHVTGEPDFLTIYTDAISVMSSALSIFGDSITSKMEHDFEMSNFDSDGATKFVCRMGWDIYNASTPPQGSVASFKEAYKHGFRIMLADIFATADNKLVIAHDDNISLIGAKNSDGTAISGTVNITKSTLAQLDVYDFGIYKGSDYAGYKIPRLEDFLRFCKKYNCKIIFEMKDRSLSDEELQSFVSMINKYGLMDSITSVGYIRATDSEKFGLLFPNTPLWYDIGTLTEANINYVYNNRPSTGNYQWIYMLVNNTHSISDAITQLTEFGEYVKSKGMGLGITELSATSELTALETGEVLSMLDYIAIKDLSTYVNFLYD